jgi:hypothetical protein
MTRPALFDGRSILVACLVSMVHIPSMRNPNRIPRILRLLEVAWKASPDMRLCQLVAVTASLRIKEWHAKDLFYYEDDVLEQELLNWHGKIAELHLRANGFPGISCLLTPCELCEWSPADSPMYFMTFIPENGQTYTRRYDEVPELDTWLGYAKKGNGTRT